MSFSISAVFFRSQWIFLTTSVFNGVFWFSFDSFIPCYNLLPYFLRSVRSLFNYDPLKFLNLRLLHLLCHSHRSEKVISTQLESTFVQRKTVTGNSKPHYVIAVLPPHLVDVEDVLGSKEPRPYYRI